MKGSVAFDQIFPEVFALLEIRIPLGLLVLGFPFSEGQTTIKIKTGQKMEEIVEHLTKERLNNNGGNIYCPSWPTHHWSKKHDVRAPCVVSNTRAIPASILFPFHSLEQKEKYRKKVSIQTLALKWEFCSLAWVLENWISYSCRCISVLHDKRIF